MYIPLEFRYCTYKNNYLFKKLKKKKKQYIANNERDP